MTTVDASLTVRLIHAGTASDEEIRALVNDSGLARVVDALAEEVAFRCSNPGNTMPVVAALDVSHEGQVHRAAFRIVGGEPVRVVQDGAADAHTVLGFSVADLIRRLYGRSGRPQTGDFHNAFVPTLPADLRQLPAVMTAAALATDALLAACSSRAPDLGALAVRYGSDKWASFHWYTPHYEHHFARYRDDPVRVLEIGIGGYGEDLGGGSLKMWKRYFHRGQIFGLDIFDKSGLDEPRLTTLVGDQGDPRTLLAIAEQHGPFDLIVDDGSHINEHVHITFRTLLPYLRAGGLYVIEDLQTSYFPAFGGTSEPFATPHTSIGLLKSLLDDLHHQERERQPDQESTLSEATVTGVHVYHNVAFVEKGTNGEARLPDWMNEETWEAVYAPR